MKIIEIKPLLNGGHSNQSMDYEIPVPEGWAVIPDDMVIPDTFPFVNIKAGEIDGVMTVTDMTAGTVPGPVEPTAEEIIAERSADIKSACGAAIVQGFDANVLGRGNLHYTLTEIQQRDMEVLLQKVKDGAAAVLWHDSSRVTHELYTAEQFIQLFGIGYAHMISCKIQSDWLEQLVRDLCGAGDLTGAAAVKWDTVLPENYQAQCDEQISLMLESKESA